MSDQHPDVSNRKAADAIVGQLGIKLKVRQRPEPRPTVACFVDVTLAPQTEVRDSEVVSFGIPLPPALVDDASLIRVEDCAGKELPVFARPLAHWRIDGAQGSLRSVLLQFEHAFSSPEPCTVRILWDRERTAWRDREVPIDQTRTVETVDDSEYHRPRVLALLPPEWLCASWLVWQQIPAAENTSVPWFDAYLAESLPGSYANITAEGFAPHLFDRAAAYVKVYARTGDGDALVAALRSADFYISHLGDDGFFDRKPGDFKYVFTEGQALTYLLTGDPRYSEAIGLALEAWDRWPRVEYRGEGFWTERHTGFGLAAYLHAYELSGDPAHLSMAERFFLGVYAMQVSPLHGRPPDGGWLRAHGHENEEKGEQWLTSPWMSAFLVDGIWKLWMLTGDERCPASLAMYARFILHHGLTDDGQSLLYLANGPGLGEAMVGAEASHNVEGTYLLSLGHFFSAGTDERYLQAIERLWPPVVKQNANAPPRRFTWTFRETSMLIWFLQAPEES